MKYNLRLLKDDRAALEKQILDHLSADPSVNPLLLQSLLTDLLNHIALLFNETSSKGIHYYLGEVEFLQKYKIKNNPIIEEKYLPLFINSRAPDQEAEKRKKLDVVNALCFLAQILKKDPEMFPNLLKDQDKIDIKHYSKLMKDLLKAMMTQAREQFPLSKKKERIPYTPPDSPKPSTSQTNMFNYPPSSGDQPPSPSLDP